MVAEQGIGIYRENTTVRLRAEHPKRFAYSGRWLVGQVIYLTHHSHLCAVATQVEPRVKNHEIA